MFILLTKCKKKNEGNDNLGQNIHTNVLPIGSYQMYVFLFSYSFFFQMSNSILLVAFNFVAALQCQKGLIVMYNETMALKTEHLTRI